jgi:hypothetical protein
MSHFADESYTIYDERTHKSRKPHVCSACRETIPAGVKYTRLFTLFDGSAETVKRCERCQAIHVHLREKCRAADMWPDERLDCGIDYAEEWGPMPPEIERLAFALPKDRLETSPRL